MARILSSTPFFILCPVFLLLSQATAQPDFQYHFCADDKENSSSTFQKNLDHLLSSLVLKDDNGFGFYNLSYGNDADIVYTMGLRIGDIDPQVCRTCLNDCSYLLRQRCPDKKEAVGWYNNCTLRYANHSILGVMETIYIYYMLNAINVSSNSVDAFSQDLGTLFDALKDRAASGDSLRKFATGNATAPDFRTFYVLVQCSPDLSPQECSDCLDYLYGSLYGLLLSGKIGGRVVGPSCNFRYEIQLFYGPPSSNRTTSTQGKESKISTTVIVAIVLSIVVSVVLLIISACVYLRRKKKNDAETLQLYQYVEEIESLESLQYSFDTIRVGTDNFSEENKLGQGGFGSV